ncbi:polysaccharide deacetylase [Aureimonas altamirensis]|uniref:polysaccharide deacetylase family protein n=1 Tax=Aureimonas altamirensis TaxID=370622 RepID=UPI001E49F46D|nr:polysaccharide deacetylase [Aureimonas altamirensis]UHD46420.1 polysaccharide deacetylase [Aureimonas altamirensis]
MALTLIENAPAWPNGARCAVCLSFDMDGETLVHRRFPDTAPDQVALAAQLRYEPAVAIARLLTIFRDRGLRQTFFVPGWCVDTYPHTVEQIAAAGHEIAHHGYAHARPNSQPSGAERESLRAGIESIQKLTGARPCGYRAPAFQHSRDTVSHLLDEGFLYDSSLFGDDVPYLVGDGARALVELPTDITLDDWTQFACMPDFGYMMPIATPRSALEMYKAEFDAAWRHGGLFVTVWHPFLTGRVARAEMMIELIEYMQELGDVWFATLSEIAAHCQSLIDAGEWMPRHDILPFCTGPLPPGTPG